MHTRFFHAFLFSLLCVCLLVRGGDAYPGATPKFFMGANLHSGWYFGTPEAEHDLLRQAGFLAFRDGCHWRFWQPGGKEFTPHPQFDRTVASALKNNLIQICTISGSNEIIGGAYPKTPEQIEKYIQLVSYIVSRYKGKIKYYGIWNEWEGGSGMDKKFRGQGDVESYIRLLKAVYPVVKKIDPDAQVVCNSIMRGTAWLESACKLGLLDYCDVYCLNIYVFEQRGNGDSWIARVRDHVDVARKYTKGQPKPFIVTEFGWPTHDNVIGSTEEASADNLAQSFLLARTIPEFKTLSWYEFHDQGYLYDYVESNFGMTTPDYTPKAAFYATQSVAPVVQYGDFIRFVPCNDPKIRLMQFKMPDGKHVLAAWSVYPEARVKLVLNRNGGTPVEPLVMTVAGHTPLLRSWGYQDWVPPWGLPKNVKAKREREPNKDLFSMSLTNRPILLYGIPENVTVQEIDVQKRPAKASGASVGFFPTQTAFVPHSAEGAPAVVDASTAKNWRYLYWGPAWAKWDCGLEMKMDYNDERLHIVFTVFDNKHNQGYPANEIWQGDSLQVLFASIDKDNPVPKNATAYQICQTNDGKPVCVRDYSQHDLSTPTQVVVKTTPGGGKIVYDVTFPMSELGVTDCSGRFPLAMSVVVNDHDGDSRARKGYLHWGDGVATGKVDIGKFAWLFFKERTK